MPLALGEMTTLVTFQHKTAERDDVLRKPAKWEDFDEAWCAYEAADGAESQPEKQTIATQAARWRTHWTDDLARVTTRMRMKLDNGELWEIKSIENPGRMNRELVFSAVNTGQVQTKEAVK